MKLVTASFIIEVEGEVTESSDQRLKELCLDMLVQAEHEDGTEAFDWIIEEEE